MADRRPSRFRLPWLSTGPAPRPTAEPQPPRPTEVQAPAQPIAARPIQRPPFRSPGIAPAQPPSPPAQASRRTEPQPQSPRRATTEPQQVVQPTSPSIATTQTRSPPAQPPPPAQAPQRTEPQPQSPPRATTEPQQAVQPTSLSIATTQTRSPSVPPAQASQRTEPQPQSPPRATTEPQQAVQPTSPSIPTTQTRSPSVPPSPSQGVSQPVSQTRAASQTESPSRAGRQSRAASVPTSPSQIASQSQEAVKTAPQPQSPPLLVSQHAGQISSQTSSPPRSPVRPQPTESQPPSPSKMLQATNQETSQTALSASQREEPKLQMSLPPPQVHLLETEITSERASQSENEHIQVPAPVTAVAPTSTSTLEATDRSQNSNANITGDNGSMPHTEPEKEMKETEKGKKFMQEQQTKGKMNSSTHGESTRSTKPKLLAASTASGTHAKETLTSAIHDEHKKHVKEDNSDGKKMITISSNGEKVKVVSSNHPKARSRAFEPHQKPPISNGEQVTLHKEIREDISKFINKLGEEQAKLAIEGQPVSVLTLAGENRGALMHIESQSARKDGSIHIHRGYKFNPDESTEATTDDDRSSKKRFKDPLTKEDWKTRAFINSNTQGINNSILSQASAEERNPGVHLILTHNLAEHSKHSTHTEPPKTHKAEFNITPSDKLTYEPTIRRRCLRGLFLETSDSDTDNPEKPRRHGCRYSCGVKSKDEDRGVL